MFITRMAPQVISAATEGAIVPVWFLTAIFAVLAMLFVFWLGRKKPDKHVLLNWLGLFFATVALIAASQTRFVAAIVAFFETLLAAIANGFALTVIAGFAVAVPLIALALCAWMFQRTFPDDRKDEDQTVLHFWMGLLTCLLAMVFTQSNEWFRGFMAGALDTLVGIPMRAIMSFIGGPTPDTAGGNTAGQVFVPGSVLTIIFGVLFTMFCLWLGRKKPKRRKLFNWLALAFSTATLVAATQIGAISAAIDAIANAIASLAHGFSRAQIEATTAGLAGLIFIALIIAYGVTLSKRHVRGQFILMPLIGVMVIILAQSNQTASEVAIWLANTGVGLPKDIILGFAETI